MLTSPRVQKMAFILEVTIDSVLQCVSCMGATFFQDKYSEKWHQCIQASRTPSRILTSENIGGNKMVGLGPS